MQDSSQNQDQNGSTFPNWLRPEDTENVYQVIVNYIIPRSPLLAYEYGVVQYYGALDLHIDEFLQLTRESLGFPQNIPDPQVNNMANGQTLLSSEISEQFPLVETTMMGFYSEWSGYGTTRLNKPNQRRLEYDPISWKQIGYPGPSQGYHALRPYQFT